MQIVLNNRKENIDNTSPLSVQDLLELKNFTYKMLIVKVNDQTIKKDDYNSTVIQEGDKVAIVHLMTGG